MTSTFAMTMNIEISIKRLSLWRCIGKQLGLFPGPAISPSIGSALYVWNQLCDKCSSIHVSCTLQSSNSSVTFNQKHNIYQKIEPNFSWLLKVAQILKRRHHLDTQFFISKLYCTAWMSAAFFWFKRFLAPKFSNNKLWTFFFLGKTL